MESVGGLTIFTKIFSSVNLIYIVVLIFEVNIIIFSVYYVRIGRIMLFLQWFLISCQNFRSGMRFRINMRD